MKARLITCCLIIAGLLAGLSLARGAPPARPPAGFTQPTPRSYLPVVVVPSPTATSTPRPPLPTPLHPTPTPTSTPTPTTVPTVEPSPTHEPIGVFVLSNATDYTSSGGTLHIVGEVQNKTTQTVTFVKISANLFNGAQLVATDFTYATLDQLRPGDRTCFDIIFLSAPNHTSYTFEAPTYSEDHAALPTLTVLGDSPSIDSSGDYHIIGQVRSDSATQVKYVQPIGTLYDGFGRVADCDFTFVNSTDLAPGQTSA